jgi:hypothetical protein
VAYTGKPLVHSCRMSAFLTKTMADTPKTLILTSMIVAGGVAALAVMDLVTGMPFSGKHSMIMDIMFILAAVIVIYLGWDTRREMR